MRLTRLIFLCFFPLSALTQALGGNSVFNFLKYSTVPQLTAAGGVNLSQISDDAAFASYNPALIRPSMHTRMNAVFNDFYAGSRIYHLSFAYDVPLLKTSFLWSLNYFDYGKTTETDASGNEYGIFRPNDWVMQLSASRAYLDKWNYGASLKYIQSNYGPYRSSGIAIDFGIHYYDSSKLFSASAMARNIGTQLKSYPGAENEDLPFDLQVGITQRLAKAPLSFSLTAQRMHRFDIVYDDTVFNNENGYSNAEKGKFTFDKLFRHFVLGTTIYIGDRAEIAAGYNFLRRKELAIGRNGNGLHGFSMGAAVFLGKLEIRYARAYYQPGSAINQLGIGMKLNDYFGLGKWGEKIGW